MNRSRSTPEHSERREPVLRLSEGAITWSSGASPAAARRIAARLLRKRNETRAIIVCVDMRQSTNLMLNVEDFDGYARVLAQWIAFAKQVTLHLGGWFDKFTGDGFLSFWEAERLDRKTYSAIFEFLHAINHNFLHEITRDIAHHAGALPAGFGIGTGVDVGKVLLSDLTPPKKFGVTIHHETSVDSTDLGLKPVTSSVTALGRAVVGAARLAEEADPYEILAGPQFGIPIEHDHRLLPAGTSVERVVVAVKNPFGEQSVFRLIPRDLDYELASHVPHLDARRRHSTMTPPDSSATLVK